MLVPTLCLIAAGCGKMPLMDPALIPYAQEFEHVIGRDTSDATLIFMPLEPPVVGECEMETKTVRIDPTFWKTAVEVQRQELIFHELGHCILNRDHNNAQFADHCPKSIMNEYTTTPSCYVKHYEELIQELRGR